MHSNCAVDLKNMFIILFIVLATHCHADDIFPEALVFEGLGLSDIVNSSKSSELHNNTLTIAGNLNDALTTMHFHRTKINDYLCRKYVVEEILQDITDSPSYKGRSMSQDSHVTRTMSAMQADQGSSAYNAWLIKTKLLKKMYDEYDLNVRMHEKPVGFTLNNKNNESLGTHDYDTMKNEDDITEDLKKVHHSNEDSFTSPKDTVSVDIEQSQSIQYDIDNEKEYKKPNRPHHGPNDFNPTQSTQIHQSAHEPYFPQSSYEPPSLPANYGPPSLSNEKPSYPSDYGMPSFQSSYGQIPTSHVQLPSSYGPPSSSYGHYLMPTSNYHSSNYPNPGWIPQNTGHHHPTGDIETSNQSDDGMHNSDKEPLFIQGLTATDMYDLTLTAIAFLGFGTFVMHLVMDAMAVQSGATLTINSTPFNHGTTVSRVRRHNNHNNSVIWEINELSWTIVSTLDNMMANVEGTSVNCEEVKTLCQRSKRLVKTGINFSSKLLPVWNVALGWFSKKLGTDKSQPVVSALLGHCILPSQCQSN